MQTNSVLSKVVTFLVSNLLAVALLIADWAFYIILYFSLVFLLVDNEKSALDWIVDALPTKPEIRSGIKHLLQDAINGVLLSNVEGAIYQAVYTWIIFDFAGIHYVYLYCLAAAFFKTVPFMATSVIGILGAV